MHSFDWNDLRYFLELARTKSHMIAGKRLRVDHTTVRRRITALETRLHARLFTTREHLYELTSEGEQMLGYAEAIEALAVQAADSITDTDRQVSGTVRIGAPDGFGAFFLAPRIKELLAARPALKIELVATPRIFNLSKREADIAIALSPPDQNRQIVRKLTDTRLSLYATREYIEARPLRALSEIVDHTLITYIPELLYAPELDYAALLGADVGSTFETTSIFAQRNAALAGVGVAILPHYLTASEPRLVKVLPDEFMLERQFWLIAHPDTVSLARVRLVIDFVVEQVRQNRWLFMGNDA